MGVRGAEQDHCLTGYQEEAHPEIQVNSPRNSAAQRRRRLRPRPEAGLVAAVAVVVVVSGLRRHRVALMAAQLTTIGSHEARNLATETAEWQRLAAFLQADGPGRHPPQLQTAGVTKLRCWSC